MNGRIWSYKSLMNFFFRLRWMIEFDHISQPQSFQATSWLIIKESGSLSHMNLATITAYCLGVRKSVFYLTWMKLTIDNPTRIFSFFLNFIWKMSKVFWQCLITTLFLIGKQALLSLDHIIVCPLLWKSN